MVFGGPQQSGNYSLFLFTFVQHLLNPSTMLLFTLHFLFMLTLATSQQHAQQPAQLPAQQPPTCLPHPHVITNGISIIKEPPDMLTLQFIASATRRNATEATLLVSTAVSSLQDYLLVRGIDTFSSTSFSGPHLVSEWIIPLGSIHSARVPMGYSFTERIEAKFSASNTLDLLSMAQEAARGINEITPSILPSSAIAGYTAGEKEKYIELGWFPWPPAQGTNADPLLSISSISYGLTPQKSAEINAKARAVAVLDARVKAEAIARANSLSISIVLYVLDLDNTAVTVPPRQKLFRSSRSFLGDEGPAFGPSAEPREIETRGRITAGFKMRPVAV